MKKYLLFLTFMLGTALIMPLQSQTFLEKMAKKAAEKAEKKAEKKAEEKVDEQIDKGLNAAEESLEGEQEQDKKTKKKESEAQPSLSEMMSKMGMSSTPVNIENSYFFKSSITMNVKNYEKDGKLQSDGTIISYVTPGEESFAYEFVEGEMHARGKEEKGIFIMDFKNEATIILSNDKGKKTGIVYGMKGMMDESNWEDNEDESDDVDVESPFTNPNLKKTGRTKSILGYKCEEYKYEDEYDITSFWVTKEYKWDSKDFMSNVFKASHYSNGMPWGFMMESESVSKETGEKSLYSVKDINKSANKTFQLSEYEVTNLGSMKLPAGD